MIIKKEYFPKKCEICHQKDFFDAKLNQCLRCDIVETLNNPQKPILMVNQNRRSPIVVGLMVIISNLLGTIISSCGVFIFYCFYIIITRHPFEMTYMGATFFSIVGGIYLGSPIGLITGLAIVVFKIKKWHINLALGLLISCLVLYILNLFSYVHSFSLFPMVAIIGILSGLCSTIAINKFDQVYK